MTRTDAEGFADRFAPVLMCQSGYDRHNWYPVTAHGALAFLGRHLKGDARVVMSEADQADYRAQLGARQGASGTPASCEAPNR